MGGIADPGSFKTGDCSAQTFFGTDLGALRRARPEKKGNADRRDDRGGEGPTAAGRKVQIGVAMAHSVSPAEENTKQGDEEKDDAAGQPGVAAG